MANNITAAEPTGAVADYLKTLPPIQEDPESFYGDEPDYASGEEPEGEATQVETGDEATPSRQRDEQGRFIPKETPQTTETKTEPVTPETPEPAADPIAALVENLATEDRQAFEFAQALRTSDNPLALIAQQAQQAGLKDALLEVLGVPKETIQQLADPVQQAGIDPDYEPSPYEALLQPHIDKLAKFPDTVKDLAGPVAQERVDAAIHQIAPYMDASNIEAIIAAKQVQAVAEAFGHAFPAIDRAAILSTLQKDQNATYDSAVSAAIGDRYKTWAQDLKQALAERPGTPGSESEGISLADLPTDRKEYGVQKASDIYRSMFGGRR